MSAMPLIHTLNLGSHPIKHCQSLIVIGNFPFRTQKRTYDLKLVACPVIYLADQPIFLFGSICNFLLQKGTLLLRRGQVLYLWQDERECYCSAHRRRRCDQPDDDLRNEIFDAREGRPYVHDVGQPAGDDKGHEQRPKPWIRYIVLPMAEDDCHSYGNGKICEGNRQIGREQEPDQLAI